MRILTLAFALLLYPTLCHANLVSEAVEYLVKKFGKEVIEEGGEKAVRKNLEKISRRYGTQVLPVIKKAGPKAASLIRTFGDDGHRLISLYGREAVTALSSREGKTIVRLCRTYGDDVVRVFAKHPGLGSTIIKELGQDGIEIGVKLNTQQMISLLRIAPKLRKARQLQKALHIIKTLGTKGLELVLKYPIASLAFVGGTYIVVRDSESLSNPGQKVGKEVGEAIGTAVYLRRNRRIAS